MSAHTNSGGGGARPTPESANEQNHLERLCPNEDTDIDRRSTTTTQSGRAFVASSIVGAVFLWVYVVSCTGPLSVVALLFWFVSFPIAILVSMAVNALLAPLSALVRDTRFANIFTVPSAAAISVALVYAAIMYEHIPTFVGRLIASWWVAVWVACMVSVFWLFGGVDHDDKEEPSSNARTK